MSIAHEGSAPRRPFAACSMLVLLVGLLLIGGLLAWQFWPGGGSSGLNPGAQSRPVAARGDLNALEKANIAIYLEAAPSVVHVTNVAERGNPLSLQVQKVARASGSGFIWDQDGHIVTNYHVVQGADAAQVTLADQSTYSARKILAYPDKDMAVLWIDAPKARLHPILIGTSHDVKVGQITYAIGDPFGLDQSMTNGIVSALDREIEAAQGHAIQGAIQTNAAINPGNSGGPLLDSAGRLIGMNTAILSPSGAFAGIGFAIPVDDINQVVPELIRHGKVVRPRLGVQIAADQLAQQLGIEQGALILKVVPNTPAAAAGLRGTQREENGHIRVGDIIVAIDGKQINNGKELHAAVAAHKVGDTVKLTILRDGERQDVQITLQAAQ